MVYPDSFQQATIRTVTPDSVSDTGNHSSLSEPDFAPAATASPRSTARSRNPDWDPRREFSPYHSAGDEDEPTTEAKGQRARSKTTTLDEQRSEISPSFLTRTRNRLGSINATTTPLNTKVSEESVGSIGYPSIIQSPTYAGPPGPRQRLTKPPPGGGPGLITGVSRNPAAFLSPLSNADSAKILQLMKTTCGRMHGILSFRTASNTQWSSGYCAINVASGSLIYQAKGEVTQAKTLIPDLRGCHVRTLFDTELQSTYLSVSTFSSGLGLQLKPHVNETFDSWLAALLCWQPIRPKGVQNKRTKPQSVTIGDRRFNDSRRNSESTGQKDAAIIKIGNMLLWEKPTVSGARPVPGWKTLTYRQQKQNPAWQSVSGALHENGYLKLFTEASSRSEQSLLAVIQLSRLARCAVQQLEPSVLGGEYCIAIYPQYAAVAASDSTERPVFLSLETRVLFEVWFVLLRAFTIPELYGPETATPEEPVRPPNALNPPNTPITDMFRNERVVTVRITEAKLTNTSKKELDPSTGKVHSIPSEATIPSDYYAEVLLDGEVRAKTAVREKTCNPFWREDFIFLDLPPVLSNVSVLLKTLNPAQKDWTLIAHGPYTLDAQVNPMTILDDLEVSSHDATCGRVDLHLDELESGSDVEKWWPIIDDRDQVVGDMYMKVRLEETIVLMSHEYEPLSELLHAFPNNLTIHMVQILPTDLNILSSLLLNIFQVSGQAADWIAALVEDEIDGFGRDATSTAHNHFRYTARLHSNDSKESGQDREVIVRDLGRSATIEANLLFRGNSLLTKALDMHMRRLGKDYLEETIGERIRDLDESDPECEVDPMRVERPEDLERNWRNLIGLTSLFWKSIAASASKCPPELRRIFRHVRACAEDRYGDFLRSVTYSSVSGFLFLRFFCPAILNPKLFALMKGMPLSHLEVSPLLSNKVYRTPASSRSTDFNPYCQSSSRSRQYDHIRKQRAVDGANEQISSYESRGFQGVCGFHLFNLRRTTNPGGYASICHSNPDSRATT